MTSHINRFRACLIIPCYNEAKRIKTEDFCRFLEGTQDFRLIFVDDGSKDETIEVLKSVQKRFSHKVQILTSRANQGKAEAVRKGINFAFVNLHPEMVGYWDADLATPLASAVYLLQVLDEKHGLEMVFGSRVKLCGRHIERRPTRHYLGRVFATVVSIMLRLPIYDTQCGAKLFRVTRSTKEIYAEPFLSKWVFDVEILARYLRLYDPPRLTKMIYEYALDTWIDVDGSKVKPMDFLKALIDVIKIKKKYL